MNQSGNVFCFKCGGQISSGRYVEERLKIHSTCAESLTKEEARALDDEYFKDRDEVIRAFKYPYTKAYIKKE